MGCVGRAMKRNSPSADDLSCTSESTAQALRAENGTAIASRTFTFRTLDDEAQCRLRRGLLVEEDLPGWKRSQFSGGLDHLGSERPADTEGFCSAPLGAPMLGGLGRYYERDPSTDGFLSQSIFALPE